MIFSARWLSCRAFIGLVVPDWHGIDLVDDRRNSAIVAESVEEPGPCVGPILVGGSWRDAEDGRGLRDGQAGKVAELDHFRSPGLDGREPVESLVEGEEIWGRQHGLG